LGSFTPKLSLRAIITLSAGNRGDYFSLLCLIFAQTETIRS